MSVVETAVVAGRLVLQGRVQGVGLRPAVARLAQELGLSGTVCNATAGVEIHVEGPPALVSEFRRLLRTRLPAEARLTSSHWTSSEPVEVDGFHIVDSVIAGPLTTPVSPDWATCALCLQEVACSENRRHQYAFTSCTSCGPRYSIIESMPYDRCRTSMREFSLCRRCHEENISEDDRRFHAQTNACPECGPALWLDPPPGSTNSIWQQAAAVVLSGLTLAMRGLGGYQLIVDATNAAAVARLRSRKRRDAKPLAVMVQTLAQAEALAVLTERERMLLSSSERPIVLVPARSPNMLAEGIHPRLTEIGLFLPTTAIHWLLLDHVHRPLVVTSGNVEGEPLSADPILAERDLQGIADVWLHHNRDIVRPIDDSVVRTIASRAVTIRCARGAAPLSLESVVPLATHKLSDGAAGSASCERAIPPVLALGGHQKGAVALFNGTQAVLGPHVGDLETLASRQRLIEHVEQLQALYRCRADVLVHDLHPDYFTTRWAQSSGCQTLAVQHHHAHVVSAMADNDWLDREVLGVAFDGTGYGTDGTIWGGEFLRARVDAFERVGHLLTFRMPGGENAVREPWRVAAALLSQAVGPEEALRVLTGIGICEDKAAALLRLADGERCAPVTSSAGRLFDGVAALILDTTDSAYEGHPAMLLESAADRADTGAYEFALIDGTSIQLDWRGMIRQVLADRRRGCSVGVMAARFHRGLAGGIVALCERFHLPIVLSGGVFQNRLLTEWVVEAMLDTGREVGLHSRIPPNDGGLAAGQLAIALARLSRSKDETSPESDGGM